MELAGTIASILLLVLTAAWALYKKHLSKEAERKRKFEEDVKKANEQIGREQEKAIEDGRAHDVQDGVEDKWRESSSQKE